MSNMSELNIFEKEIEAIMSEYANNVKTLHKVLSGDRGAEFMKMVMHIATLVDEGEDFWPVIDTEDGVTEPAGYWYRGSYHIFFEPEKFSVDKPDDEV